MVNGNPPTTPRVFKSPVAGFSISHPLGCRCLIISKVRATMLSASARFLGVFAVVRAMEYCWHGGEAHTKSYVPGGICRQLSQFRMSVVHVALHFLSMSKLSTSNPCASRLLSTLPVPVKSTSARGLVAILKALR